MEGVEICQKVRANKIHTPILILTAKGQITDRVDGLNAGADDYLVKPFAFEELLARVKALTRRPRDSLGAILTVKDLTLNTLTYEVTRASKHINLSNREYSLLEYLMRHPNTIISRDQIINHVWNYESNILPNTVEAYIKHLRTKIDKPFQEKLPLIQTVRGFGYKIGGEA